MSLPGHSHGLQICYAPQARQLNCAVAGEVPVSDIHVPLCEDPSQVSHDTGTGGVFLRTHIKCHHYKQLLGQGLTTTMFVELEVFRQENGFLIKGKPATDLDWVFSIVSPCSLQDLFPRGNVRVMGSNCGIQLDTPLPVNTIVFEEAKTDLHGRLALPDGKGLALKEILSGTAFYDAEGRLFQPPLRNSFVIVLFNGGDSAPNAWSDYGQGILSSFPNVVAIFCATTFMTEWYGDLRELWGVQQRTGGAFLWGMSTRI